MALRIFDFTPEELVNVIDGKINKKLVKSILTAFVDNGLTYTVREAWKPKNVTVTYYRIFFYIKKSKVALIVNTGTFEGEGLYVQLRIKDWSSFDTLDQYSENVRNSILNATDCRAPYCSNDGSEYVFYYQGKEYRKCHMLGASFNIRNIKEEDIGSIMQIIQKKIAYGMSRRKSSV